MVPSCPNNCPQPILPLKYHLSTSPTIYLYNDHNLLAPYHNIFIITITFISLVNNIEARLEGAPPIIRYLHGYSILSPTIVLQRDQIYKISSSRVSMSMPPRFNTIIRRRRRSRRRSRSFEQKDIIITLSRAQWQLLMMMIKSKFRGWNIYTIHDIVVKAIQHNLNLQYYYSNYKNVGKESNGLDTTYSDNRNFVHVKQPLLRTLRRKLLNEECTDSDIGISQSREISSGVPQFTVQIYATCMDGCEPSNLHLNCGWFASMVVVNPGIFRRVAFNDCLVNAGRPIRQGHILRFTYQNSFMYRLSFKTAKFC